MAKFYLSKKISYYYKFRYIHLDNKNENKYFNILFTIVY